MIALSCYMERDVTAAEMAEVAEEVVDEYRAQGVDLDLAVIERESDRMRLDFMLREPGGGMAQA